MILNLLQKDMRAFGKSMLKLTALSLVVLCLFSFTSKNSWLLYILMSAGQISFIVGLYLMSEKMHRGELMICSLPVTRIMLVRGKIIGASLVAFAGIIIWYLLALIFHSVINVRLTDSHLLFSPIMLVFVLLYFSFFISVVLPLSIILDKLWALTNLSILFAAIFIVPFSLLYESRGLFNFNSSVGLFFLYIILITGIIGLPFVSLKISSQLFTKREL